MKVHKYILTGVLLLTFNSGFSQKEKIRRASSSYDKFAYIKTTEILLEVANKGYKSVELFEKIANSFYFNNKMEEAAKWYGELMNMNKPVNPEYYYRYAQALKVIKNYNESDKWMRKFSEEQRDDLRGKSFISNVDYLAKIDKVSRKDVQIKNLDINSEFSDFGSTQFRNLLVFASNRKKGKVYRWNEQPYLDLYTAEKQAKGIYVKPVLMNEDINTKFHESSATFTPDDKFMFFTRNNYYKKRYRKDKAGTNKLKIFRATYNYGNWDWENVVPVHFNNDEYSVAHPCVNVKGTKMYFASDRLGTTGQSDLYVVDIYKDGTLGIPKNLGLKINTEGHESFPFINEKGDLYFSSNGYPGLGGLDVYVVKDFENKYESRSPNYKVENIGRPINSSNDDFGYYENLGTKEGFFTSNRAGGKGDDDIYSFVIPKCQQILEGVVKDNDTFDFIPGATVTLYDESGNKIETVILGDDAKFSFHLECEKEYLIRGEKGTYTSDEKRFTTPSVTQELKLELLLDKDEQEVQPCDDLAKILDIPIIYFAFDKYTIRLDAEIELQKVLTVLKQYPTMHIDIRSHTDCRGTNKYNETLSENRAQSTRQYLLDKGIPPNRIKAKGYGEYRLINDCDCESESESNCSEVEHQANRRSEFIITHFKGTKCDKD